MTARILIVEDEWLIAEDYAALLRNAGHEIVGPCATARDALLTVDKQQIDAALLDMELRGEKSFVVAERLEKENIPFAFITGHARHELPPALSGKRVLSKPIENPRLLEVVRQMCRSG